MEYTLPSKREEWEGKPHQSPRQQGQALSLCSIWGTQWQCAGSNRFECSAPTALVVLQVPPHRTELVQAACGRPASRMASCCDNRVPGSACHLCPTASRKCWEASGRSRVRPEQKAFPPDISADEQAIQVHPRDLTVDGAKLFPWRWPSVLPGARSEIKGPALWRKTPP